MVNCLYELFVSRTMFLILSVQINYIRRGLWEKPEIWEYLRNISAYSSESIFSENISEKSIFPHKNIPSPWITFTLESPSIEGETYNLSLVYMILETTFTLGHRKSWGKTYNSSLIFMKEETAENWRIFMERLVLWMFRIFLLPLFLYEWKFIYW